MSKPVPSTDTATALRKIHSLIGEGCDAAVLYDEVSHVACSFSGVTAAAIYLPAEVKDGHHRWSLAAQSGNALVPEPQEQNSAGSNHQTNTGEQYIDIVCLDAPIGVLGVRVEQPLGEAGYNFLVDLAQAVSVVFERERLQSRLRHYTDRLEVLNEFNQLIASDVHLSKMTRMIAREAAYRFNADIAFCALLLENGEGVDLRGVSGLAPEQMVAHISVGDSILSQAFRLGGIMSIPDLAKKDEPQLGFLRKAGVQSIHCCTVEVLGETLGAIILASRKATFLDEDESAMLEEFAQGAAVALGNAKTRERLTAYLENLEELVQQRTADLAVQTARAEEANHAKSRFVANMSHELRTPLTAIVGYSSVLNDGIFGPVNEKQKEALAAITRSSEHLKELIDDVLNLSRIEAGKEKAEPARLDLGPLLQQVHRLMLQTAISKNITLSPLVIPEEVKQIRIWFDGRHIRQVLINLMSNAIKYTPSGGTVTLTAELVGDKAQLGIQDTGVGITPELMAKLFERFERGADSYSKNQAGTGIGLALTKHLVDLNGGRIEVESEVGKGSCFTVLVPLAESAVITTAAVDESEAAAESARLDGLNVLIVDDNIPTCEVLATIVRESGGNPYVAHSVAEAKSQLTAVVIDSALVDLAMPGESGITLIEYCRKHSDPAVAALPMIVVSACVFENDRSQAEVSGASDFIAKPFRPDELVRTIRYLTTAAVLEQGREFKSDDAGKEPPL